MVQRTVRLTRRRFLAGASGAVGIALVASLPRAAHAQAGGAAAVPPRLNVWASGGTLHTPRVGHTATPLRDGTILVIGGGTSTVERYDPATYTSTPRAPLSVPRTAHTATPLPDGTVLVVGGNGDGKPVATAERYDPAVDRWSPVPAMGAIRSSHTATLLPDGAVLVAGGFPLTTAAERYDPGANRWSPVAPLAFAHGGATATLTRDGRVVVLEGTAAAVEVYDPAMDTWTTAFDATPFRGGLEEHATAVSRGDILVIGGIVGEEPARVSDRARGYVIAASDVRFSVGTLGTGRHGHTATTLPNGDVLAIGGSSDANPGRLRSLASVEQYNFGTRRWSPAPPLSIARRGHTATVRVSDSVVVIGGYGVGNTMLASVEVFL